MKRIVLLSALALGACSTAQVAKIQAGNAKVAAQAQAIAAIVCPADTTAQPIVVPLAAGVATAVAPGSAPAVAGAVALDETVIHPDIQAACDALLAAKASAPASK